LNAQQALEAFLGKIMPYLPLLSVISFLIVVSGLIYRNRPKTTNEKIDFIHFNSEITCMVERHAFNIDWGVQLFINWTTKFTRNYLSLKDISRKASYEVTWIAPGGSEIPIPLDFCSEKAKGTNKTIFLTHPEYFKDKNIHTVYLLTRTPASQEPMDKIEVSYSETHIEIRNNNQFEVRNYVFKLPESIKINKLNPKDRNIDCLRFDIPFPMVSEIVYEKLIDCVKSSTTDVILIRLPPAQGNVPGKHIIDLC
jgi:hypothetical protein